MAVVNGRMSERSFGRYRRFGWFFRPVFRRLSAVGVQSDVYAERLRDLGAAPVVTGNLKYDAAISFDPAVEATVNRLLQFWHLIVLPEAWS